MVKAVATLVGVISYKIQLCMLHPDLNEESHCHRKPTCTSPILISFVSSRLNVPVTIFFQLCRDGAIASVVPSVLFGEKMCLCSRTQHGGGRYPRPLALESEALPLDHRAPLPILIREEIHLPDIFYNFDVTIEC